MKRAATRMKTSAGDLCAVIGAGCGVFWPVCGARQARWKIHTKHPNTATSGPAGLVQHFVCWKPEP